MDTGTHIVMGVGLAGLSTLDPSVTLHPYTAEAIFFGTLLGSQAPDFDTVLKLKDNATYIRHHRGITHSIPATLLWPILISGVLKFFIPEASLLHLWLWTFLAVFLHVFVDIFNAYGTQALRPYNNKWIALGIINIFDPVIFSSHIVGFTIWHMNGHPGKTFLVIYGFLIIYYLWRIYSHHQVVNKVKEAIPTATDIIVSPTIRWSQYHLAIKSPTKLYVGEAKSKEITIIDTFNNVPVPENDIFMAAKKDANISAFLHFSPIYRWEIERLQSGYEVRFIDLRYLSNGHYPFVAVVQLKEDLSIMTSYTGWIFSEDKLQKKLAFAMDDF